MNRLWSSTGVVVFTLAIAVRADEQVWIEGGPDQIWSTGALNWGAGSAWINGNSARFSGAGETVDVSGPISVSNITFDANGYVITDADSDGSLTVLGKQSVISVVNVGYTGVVSEVIEGSGGLMKKGLGTLQLKGANTYAGTTTVSIGILCLNPNTLTALGAAGTGNETVVEDGATLDLNSALSANCNEDFIISGSGVGGVGALINTGPTIYYNVGFRNLTLTGGATIGGDRRTDLSGSGSFTGNGHTLTIKGTGGFEMAVSRSVNGSPIVIESGTYILQNGNALGGTTAGDTIVNGGRIVCWGSYTIPERIIFNGGSFGEGASNQTFTLVGHLTLNANVGVGSSNYGGIQGMEIPGFIDGPGGFTKNSGGWCYITGETNTYSGPTVINSGQSLWVGKPSLYSGILGSGPVTNNGTLYGYSSQISQGDIVNNGTLYCYAGVLGAGRVENNASLHFDRAGAFTLTNGFFGSGLTTLRYGAELTIDGSVSSNANLRICNGVFTLTNGAEYVAYSSMTVADRSSSYYPTYQTNIYAVVNVTDGCLLSTKSMTFGNDTSPYVGPLTGILNQVGGVVRTTGSSDEGNGIRLGHYPQARSFYNMMGGTLIIEKDYDLGCATDGQGWFNMTGGEVFATRVMLNERTGSGGSGRLTVAGGVLNVGTLNTDVSAISNGITVDAGGPYLVEYGGAGGVVRAVTNFVSALNATLYGTGTNAITFDTAACVISLSGNLTGAGGLNKSGAGALVLSGNNTYAGPTRVLEGSLTRTAVGALPAGGEVLFGVTADDAGGRLYDVGDLSMEGLLVGVANPEDLDVNKSYTIATYGGALTAGVGGSVLPEPWYIYYDWENKRVQLKAAIGTAIWLR